LGFWQPFDLCGAFGFFEVNNFNAKNGELYVASGGDGNGIID
jgi:hypothetical protein